MNGTSDKLELGRRNEVVIKEFMLWRTLLTVSMFFIGPFLRSMGLGFGLGCCKKLDEVHILQIPVSPKAS